MKINSEMRKLMTISLLLMWFVGFGQEEYLLKRFYRMNGEDTSYRYKFEYNDDWSLNSYRFYYGSNYDEFTFENDTLVASQEFSRSYTYHYFTDSVIQIEWSSGEPDTTITHYLDQQGRVVHTWEPDGFIDHYYNDWEGENVMKHSYHMMNILYWFTIKYSDYLNPLYPVNKNLRDNHRSSYNYPLVQYDESGNPEYTYEVVESLGDYPAVVNGWDGNIHHQLRYEYHVITNISPPEVEETVVHSVEYLDMLGRKIQKPQHGFYIERKTTNQGVISKKYFIP
jgi:hypothetical protein